MKIRGVAFLGALGVVLSAQTPSLQFGVMYICGPTNAGLKVYSCAGQGNADACETEAFIPGRGNQRGKSPRAQVMAMLPLCHVQTAAEGRGGARGGAAPAAPAGAQTGAGGFKVGDTVQVNTAFGWMNAKVLRVDGNRYFVHAQSGAEVWKPYPSELHRIGPANAEDHANGIYDIGERVQLNFEGHWVESKIHGTLNNEYDVDFPGNRHGYVSAQNLRPSTAPPPAPPKGGVPPKPGYVSCAGKIEGRYATTGGFGSLQITFRAGKANVGGGLGDDEFLECWMSGDKIILHKPSDPNVDMPIDINTDGTLQTPLGEIRKKGN